MRKLYKNRCGLLCILTMCLLCVSCLPEDLELPKLPRVKDVATTGADAVFCYAAKLSGVVTLVEPAYYVKCGIIYGRSTPFVDGESVRVACDDYTKVQVSDDSFECCFSVSIAGLMPNTTYYYCAYALDAGQYIFGEMRSFTTDVVGEAVDLGLSVKWASWNVGASSPEEYGDYFAWGETVTKSRYTESNSVTFGLSMGGLKSRGIIDADGNLTAEYDAATAIWGGSWRMPTKAEQDELLTNCTWEWTTMNGVYGCKVTGPNGNSIFLPAAGDRINTSLLGAGSNGSYWSAAPYSVPPYSDSRYAYSLYFYSGYYEWEYCDRYYGHTVRPVSE